MIYCDFRAVTVAVIVPELHVHVSDPVCHAGMHSQVFSPKTLIIIIHLSCLNVTKLVAVGIHAVIGLYSRASRKYR